MSSVSGCLKKCFVEYAPLDPFDHSKSGLTDLRIRSIFWGVLNVVLSVLFLILRLSGVLPLSLGMVIMQTSQLLLGASMIVAGVRDDRRFFFISYCFLPVIIACRIMG